MDYAQAASEFKVLKAQYDAGTLSEPDFKARLQDLMVQDEQGCWWMLGYETGQWYVHDGEKWVQSEPPPAKASGFQASAEPVATPAAPVRRRWVWVAAGVIGVILVVLVIAQLARRGQALPAPTPAPAAPAPANVPAPGPGSPLWADIYEIRRGECTVVHWNVPGAAQVRLVGPGFDADIIVPGSGNRKVCPPETAPFGLQSPDRKFIADIVIQVLQ